MAYKLHREVADGQIVLLSLGILEVDAYLIFNLHMFGYS